METETYQVYDKDEAMGLIRKACRAYLGKKDLPPELEEVLEELKEAIKHAELFIINLHAVDWGMVTTVTNLQAKFTDMYDQWVEDGKPPTIH